MVSFYYSVYLLVSFMVGGSFVRFFDGRSLISLPLVLIMYNLFWFAFVI